VILDQIGGRFLCQAGVCVLAQPGQTSASPAEAGSLTD